MLFCLENGFYHKQSANPQSTKFSLLQTIKNRARQALYVLHTAYLLTNSLIKINFSKKITLYLSYLASTSSLVSVAFKFAKVPELGVTFQPALGSTIHLS